MTQKLNTVVATANNVESVAEVVDIFPVVMVMVMAGEGSMSSTATVRNLKP